MTFPKYFYKGIPIHLSDEVPDNEIWGYSFTDGKVEKTITKIMEPGIEKTSLRTIILTLILVALGAIFGVLIIHYTTPLMFLVPQ